MLVLFLSSFLVASMKGAEATIPSNLNVISSMDPAAGLEMVRWLLALLFVGGGCSLFQFLVFSIFSFTIGVLWVAASTTL